MIYNLLGAVLSVPLILLLLYLAVTTFYLVGLAAAYFIVKKKNIISSSYKNCFAVIVPAHNEELLIGSLCQSLLKIDYPDNKYVIHIVADNCIDKTVEVCSAYPVEVLERNDPSNAGKGQALAWSLKLIDLDRYNAVFIVDADNYVDSNILLDLNKHLNNGECAIQCHNAVGNRSDSWFTQLLFVSRIISNNLYHEAKYRLGLTSYLMGNGLCFRADLLKRKGWTAFSAGEDWEYYAQLIEDGVTISFAAEAKVFHQESKSLNQATSQRLRWSSGRFGIAKTLGIRLLKKGFSQRDWRIVDASFPLLLPNYSLLINLTLAGVIFSLVLSSSYLKLLLLTTFSFLVFCQFVLFIAGTIIAGSPLKTLKAAFFVPFFLVWKAVIDILCITGLYKEKKWIRTKRH